MFEIQNDVMGTGYSSFYLAQKDSEDNWVKLDLRDSDDIIIHCVLDGSPEIVRAPGAKVLVLNSKDIIDTGILGYRYSFKLYSGGVVSETLINRLQLASNWRGDLYIRPRSDSNIIFKVLPFEFGFKLAEEYSYYLGNDMSDITLKEAEYHESLINFSLGDSYPDPDDNVAEERVQVTGEMLDSGDLIGVFDTMPLG